MSEAVRSIVIVGGGAAGWITAGTIAAKHPAHGGRGVQVTLIESPSVRPIGVGEGTWPTMRATLAKIGVSETDFVRECDASFKQGAKFVKWVNGGDYYYHPLVLPQGFLQGNLVPHWLQDCRGKSFSAAVASQEFVCERGLAPKQISTPEYGAVENYAYHLNAGTFGEFLKRHCLERLGVKHVLDDVIAVNGDGDIESLTTRENGDLPGDLFVDCTGFNSILLGKHFGIPFESRQDVLFIDKALAVQVPYEDENSPVASHTISTAQDAGWIWDIGLSTRRGVGHVYSTAHTSEERAAEQLREYLKVSVSNIDGLSYRTIDIKPGHRQKFWERNCVAVGLSAGFLEPLEASALVLVELSATMIAEQLPVNRQVMDIVARRFNEKFLYRWDRIIDFLKLHYVLSKRSDTQFWVDNRRPETVPGSLQELLELWKYQPPWHDDFVQKDEVFPAASYQYVLYGMGFRTESGHLGMSPAERRFAEEQFAENEKRVAKLLSALPSNRELLNKINEYGLQKI